MHVHRRLALHLGSLGLLLQLSRLGHDRFLFALVTVDFLEVSGLLVTGGERRTQLGEVLLAALRLVEIPLVGSFGLANRGFVLEKQGVVLRRAPMYPNSAPMVAKIAVMTAIRPAKGSCSARCSASCSCGPWT